jgi:O-antigen ligase
MHLTVWTRLFLLLAVFYIVFLVVLSRSKGTGFWKYLLVAAAFLAAPWKFRKFK